MNDEYDDECEHDDAVMVEMYANKADLLCITFQTLANITAAVGDGFQMAANLAGMHANKRRADVEQRRIAAEFDGQLAELTRPREEGS